MENLKALNKKETELIIKGIEEHFDCRLDLSRYAAYKNEEGKLYLLERERLGSIDLKKIRINKAGMYFGKDEKGGFRLSIEGAQMVNPKKNFIGLGKEQVKGWMRGEDIEISANVEGLVIIKYGNDILGCGRYKEGKVLNYVPRERRINA